MVSLDLSLLNRYIYSLSNKTLKQFVLLFLFLLDFSILHQACFFYFLAGAALGRFVPYFERRCVRPLTPAVSNAPRTMW